MDARNKELAQLQSYVEEIDNEVTMLLQNLQWDRKSFIENAPMVTCKYDIGHRVPVDKKEIHERDCFMRKEGYSKDERLLPDPFDPTAETLIQLSNEDIKQIIVDASKSDPLFKIGWGCRDSATSQTLGRLQATYTSDERCAIHAAVVRAVPSCHDLADLASTSTNICERKRIAPKSRQEILAELRDLRRRRVKYRGAANTGSYSDVLRGIITSQMELLTNPNAADEPEDQAKAQKEDKKITFTIRKEATLPTVAIKPNMIKEKNSKIAKVDDNIYRNITQRELSKEKSKREGSRELSRERTRERTWRDSSRERYKRKYRERYEIDDSRNKSMGGYSKQGYKGDYSRDKYKRGHSREIYRRDSSNERYRRDSSKERYRRDSSKERYRRDSSGERFNEVKGSDRCYNNKQNRNPRQWGNMGRHTQQGNRDRCDNRFRREREVAREDHYRSRNTEYHNYDRGTSSYYDNYRNGNRRCSKYESNDRQSKRRSRRDHKSDSSRSDSRSSSQSRSSSRSESRIKKRKFDRKRKSRKDDEHANKDKRRPKRAGKGNSYRSRSRGSRSYSDSGSSISRKIKKERMSSDREVETQRSKHVNLNTIELKQIKKEERSVSCSSNSSWE